MSGIVPPSYGSDPGVPRRGIDDSARPVSPTRAEPAPATILPPAVILPQLPAWLRPPPPYPETPAADHAPAPPASVGLVAKSA